MRPSLDDLARISALHGVVIPRADLERLLPSAVALYEDLERLRALPTAGVEPAFTPVPPAAAASDPTMAQEGRRGRDRAGSSGTERQGA